MGRGWGTFPTWFFSKPLDSFGQLRNTIIKQTCRRHMLANCTDFLRNTYIGNAQAHSVFYRTWLCFYVSLTTIFIYLTEEGLLEPSGLNRKQFGEHYSGKSVVAPCLQLIPWTTCLSAVTPLASLLTLGLWTVMVLNHFSRVCKKPLYYILSELS